MRIGDYVRFKDKRGNTYIRQIVDLPKDIRYGAIKIDREANYTNALSPKNIIKTSSNILELIKPQDLLYIDIDCGYAGGIIVPRIPETQNELNKMIVLIKNGTLVLKGIVTYEQIKEREYEL